MGPVEICSVETDATLQEFVDFPWSVYKDCKNWVPPLKAHVRRLLDPARHPFWKFSERILFMAKQGSQVVGRIAGIIDNNLIRFQGRKTAKWGFFECVNDPEVAAALFSAVQDWAREKGMEEIQGPMNPSTNYDIGLLVEGFEYPPVVNMPYNLAYYEDLVLASAYTKEKDLVAFQWDRSSEMSERMARLCNRWSRHPKIHVRPMDRRNLFHEARLVKEIYEHAWSDNWGFVPMTEDEINDMAAALKWIGDTEVSFFVYYRDEPVAVCLILLDVNPLLKRLNGKLGLVGLLKVLLHRREIQGARLVLFGIKRSHHKIGHAFPFVALGQMFTLCKQKHQYVEFGWILEDNEATRQMARELGAREYKRYRVFNKPL
jgi:hypothetical protein